MKDKDINNIIKKTENKKLKESLNTKKTCTCGLNIKKSHMPDHLDTKLHTQSDRSGLNKYEILEMFGFQENT